jgi:hypothetical protein
VTRVRIRAALFLFSILHSALGTRPADGLPGGNRLQSPGFAGAPGKAPAKEELVADKKTQMELKFQIDEHTAEGIYSNFLSVLHNQAEFVMDFGRIVPGKPEVKILSRMICTPITMKQIVRTLQENLERYEASFGPVPADQGSPSPHGFVQ